MTPTLLNNRYQILNTLGRGGFGETFLAADTHMPSHRVCVVKQLKPIANQPQIYQLVQERFEREAAILEDLKHPQIPQLFAYFVENNQFYLVQEHIEGKPLSALMQQGCLSESDARQILVGLLPVLAYIHDRGIVHRDIKPDNIILRQRDRQPVLIDFGAVRETMGLDVNSQGQMTSSIVIGTPGFMPSEQAAGRPVFASDLYSLALTVVCLLTQKLPSDLTNPHTSEVQWRGYAPRVSLMLANVLDRALQYHPRDRFATASEMLQALQVQPPTLPSNPPTQPVPLPPPPSKLPAWGTAAIAGVIIGVCVAGTLVWLNRPPSPDNPESEPTEQASSATASNQAVTPPSPTPESSPPLSSFYFLADSAYQEWGNVEQRLQELRQSGYANAGQFWIPDYANLSGKPYHQVYVAQFDSRDRCIEVLRQYGQQKSDSYCALASPNASDNQNQVMAEEVVVTTASRPSPAQAIRDQYDATNRRDYSTSWQRLSPQFRQKSLNNSYSKYTDWWDTVQHTKVEQIDVIQSNTEQATVEIKLQFEMKTGQSSRERRRTHLQWDRDRQMWIISDSYPL